MPSPSPNRVNMLKEEWKKDTYAERLLGRKIFIVCEETFLLLTSSNVKHIEATEVIELRSSQEEADTRIVLHCKHMLLNCHLIQQL